MSAKRRLNRKTNRSYQGEEVGILYDPKAASIQRVQRSDGKWVKPILRNPSIVSIIDPEYLVAAPDDDNPRNTIAFRLAEMFLVAANLYGARDTSYTFAGVEFTSGRPRTRFCRGKSVIIQLNTQSLFDRNQLMYQLAHESIHLLSPSPERPVKILEEGMAEVFAFLYMRDTMRFIVPPPQTQSYGEAQELVSILLTTDREGIKRIREEEPVLSNVTKSLILKHYPTLEEGVAARLTRTFVGDGCDDQDILTAYANDVVE